jgi:hypothetical protein
MTAAGLATAHPVRQLIGRNVDPGTPFTPTQERATGWGNQEAMSLPEILG